MSDGAGVLGGEHREQMWPCGPAAAVRHEARARLDRHVPAEVDPQILATVSQPRCNRAI